MATSVNTLDAGLLRSLLSIEKWRNGLAGVILESVAVSNPALTEMVTTLRLKSINTTTKNQ